MTAIATYIPAADAPPLRTTLSIRPRRGAAIGLDEVWRYRDLLWILAARDVRVRYKQTVLGALWAILQPVLTMVVFTFFFGKLLGVPGMSDPVFVLAGVLPWTLFSATVTASTQSLTSSAAIIEKVYFPRLIVPLSSAGAPLVDYAFSLIVLIGLMAWHSITPTPQLLLLIPLLVTTAAAALGAGILLAALTARYRDLRFVVPFLLQVWFFVTPVLYPQSVIPERFRWISSLNPMSGTIEAYRAAVTGTPVDYTAWAISAAVAAIGLFLALTAFARVERRLADLL